MAKQEIREWYVSLNGEQRGPVTTATIRDGVGHGTLSPADWVWREGMEEWRQIREMVDFDPSRADRAGPRRWWIWLGFFLGLIVSAITVALNYERFLQLWRDAPLQDFVAETIGYVAAAPLLFMLIVIIRNLIVCKRP